MTWERLKNFQHQKSIQENLHFLLLHFFNQPLKLKPELLDTLKYNCATQQ